jgi:hypothetical protein
MTTLEYKKYRLRQITQLAKYTLTLGTLITIVVVAPNEAVKVISYIGAFLFGGSKLGQNLR